MCAGSRGPDYAPGMASHHLDGARLLAAQPALHVADPHALMRLYMPCPDAPRVERPFRPAYAQLRYTEAAATRLFERVLGSVDRLIETSRRQAKDLERLQKEVEALRKPLHAAVADYVRKLRRSLMKRYFAGRAVVDGLMRAS